MKKILLFAIYAVLLASCGVPPELTPYTPPTPILNYTPEVFDAPIDAPASSQRLADSRPNIIYILTDDQPYHTVEYMPTVKNVLMEDGVVFENAFATTPLCCPSRASIFSGQYASNHQVLTNTLPLGGATKFDDSECMAIWMQDAGYHTGYYGKYMNGYEDLQPYGYVPPGWDEWGAFLSKNISESEDQGNAQYYFDYSLSENGEAVVYEKNNYNYSADVVTNKALEFISESKDAPFFLMLGYYNPHSPYIAAPRHKSAFRAQSDIYWDWVQYRPPNFNEEDIRDKPDYISDLSPLSETELDTVHKQILRSLLSVDDGVASILAALEQAGLSENTIVVFMSDNGLTIGDHRFGASKNCPYEACIKVPLVVYAPWKFTHRVETGIAANIDIAPTFAEWAGAVVPENVDGVSLESLLQNPSGTWRNEILLEHWPTEEGIGSMIPEFFSIRTMEWKYTEYITGEIELYDLINDPFELENLAGKRDYREIEENLALKLAELKTK